jgi:hypothetical protein
MCVLPGANARPVFSIVIRAKACTRACGDGGTVAGIVVCLEDMRI